MGSVLFTAGKYRSHAYFDADWRWISAERSRQSRVHIYPLIPLFNRLVNSSAEMHLKRLLDLSLNYNAHEAQTFTLPMSHYFFSFYCRPPGPRAVVASRARIDDGLAWTAEGLTTSLFVLLTASIAAADHLAKDNRHNAYVRRRDQVLARQATSGAPAAATGSTTQSASVTAVTTPTVPGTQIPPLDQITSGAPIETPLSMFTTFAAGAMPPYSGAPALPAISIVAGNYPALDKVPPTDSPQVQQWLSEIDLSGVPDLVLTNGSCASNPTLAADQSRCWWTCGGCTRPTDIVACPDPLHWGVSFDDGPSPYTPKLVNFLHDHNITATFYVVGSRVISRPDMLQTEYMLGHEISDHTWSHTPLTTLTNEQIVAELGWTRQAIGDVLGVAPTTMRPPYGDIDDRVRGVCKAMGLTPVIWTSSGNTEFDTNDWHIPGGTANGTSSFDTWNNIVATATSLTTGFIALEHDLWQQTVDMAVGYILPLALNNTPAFTFSSVIECLHKDPKDAYAEFNTSGPTSSNTTASGTSGTSGPAASGGSSTGQTKSAGFSGKVIGGCAYGAAVAVIAIFASLAL